MTKERLLSDAQINLGMALPLYHRDLLRAFLVLLSRGVPIAEVIETIAEIHNVPPIWGELPVKRDPGASKHGTPNSDEWEHVLPKRECRGCGVGFQPHTTNQTYHEVQCRMDAYARLAYAKTRATHMAFVAAEVEAKAEAEAEARANAEPDFADAPALAKALELNDPDEPHLAYVAAADAKAAANAELIEAVVDEAIRIFDAEAEDRFAAADLYAADFKADEETA